MPSVTSERRTTATHDRGFPIAPVARAATPGCAAAVAMVPALSIVQRAPCNIFTTSGTTSAPKFVLHRQGAIASHAQQVARGFGFDAAETLSLVVLPLCGVFGFNQAMATLAAESIGPLKKNGRK